MTAALFAPSAPTDAQLAYIAGLCEERAVPALADFEARP
jgi:hypothetical protein